jgi:hypothetical protein
MGIMDLLIELADYTLINGRFWRLLHDLVHKRGISNYLI